jgi:nucleotide-binding universal stress UspA family protein
MKIGGAKRKAAHWAELAREHGVRADYVVDERGFSVADQILRLVRNRHFGLIAMDSQSGPVSSALLGSITRQVVRHAACPVLVLKPRFAQAVRPITETMHEEYRKAA